MAETYSLLSRHPVAASRRPDRVAGADPSAAEHVCAQAAAVDQTSLHILADEPGEIAAGLAGAHAAEGDPADPELAADEVVERDAAGNDVAARLSRRDCDAVLRVQRAERFELDERHMAARPRFLRERADAVEVAVALDPAPGDDPRYVDASHRGARGVRD